LSGTGFSESSDRRVLGGIVFVDAITSMSVAGPLTVTSTSLKLRANRSGVHAIFDAPGFSHLTNQFNPEAPGWPAPQSFEVVVRDASRQYLARRAAVQAPQSLDTVFNPQHVLLYPSPSAPVAPNWALVRASVIGNDGNGLPWAVIQVIKGDNSVAATGMTDARGEALLAVMGLGVQVSTAASGSVTEITIPVTVQAWFDPNVLQQPATWLPNPDDILGDLSNTSLKTATASGALGAGQVLLTTITISV
jgi:hypothetical protein